MSGVLEDNSKERVRNAVLEMTELIKVIKQDYSMAYEELFVLLKSDLYVEPYVGLHELLEPDKSLLYQHTNVEGSLRGKFKEAFNVIIENNKEKYPNLIAVSKRKKSEIQPMNNNATQDFDLNDYDEATIAVYVPYIEDVNNNFFDVNDELTLVPGVIDADSGLGYIEQNDGSWSPVTANDSYSENNFTMIIEPNNYSSTCSQNFDLTQSAPIAPELSDGSDCYASGGNNGGVSGSTNLGNQYTGDCDKLEPGASFRYVRQVLIGHAKIRNKKQYDKYISFTFNGGGSEIRIGRLDSRDQIDIDSLGNISANQWDNVVGIDFSRQMIRNGDVTWAGSLWHENWECNDGDHEVLLGIWEEDTEGDIIFDQTITWDGDTLFAIDATIQNRSKDEIIRKIVREEDEFFATNMLDQGCGSATGKFSFDDRDWAKYDCGSNFWFTMPHRWVPLN